MEFHVFHDMMLFEESITYIIMGVTILAALAWWVFIIGKEPKSNGHH